MVFSGGRDTTDNDGMEPLHNFNLPSLKWGNQKLLLTCMSIHQKMKAMASKDDDCDTSVKFREKLMIDFETEVGKMKDAMMTSSSPVSDRPWNLRTRRGAVTGNEIAKPVNNDVIIIDGALWRMASQRRKMKVQCVNPDRISSLPQDITGYILTRMPIRDAIRTSILSRKWRCSWKSMTRLAFDDKMVKVPSNCQQLKKYKLASAILNVLLLHAGSIPEIKIDVKELDLHSEFDQIICYLSKNNHLQKMAFLGSLKPRYKLPSAFFSLQGLEVIVLLNCLFRPPVIFAGFSKLRIVGFRNVDITSTTLQFFLSSCPLLRYLTLIADDSRDFARGSKLTFVELLQCVPLIEHLKVKGAYMEYLSAGGMPHKLPTSLVQLKCLSLGVCYDEEDEVSSVLCLIKSSPNLEEIDLTAYDKSGTAQISKIFPEIQDYSGFTLDNLKFFWLKNFTNKDLEVDFLKLVMAKSPMLKKAQMELCESVSLEEENEILRNLLQLWPFPCASPSAKLIVKRPKPDS